jgi:F-box domain
MLVNRRNMAKMSSGFWRVDKIWYTVQPFTVVTTMLSIPIDVLREILEHVREADLPTLCRVNKIFCSCSQDVLYREIVCKDSNVINTLARSTDLARRVRSFQTSGECPELATALRNMSSLRTLDLWHIGDESILDDSFDTTFPNSESLINCRPT